ncbi:MAG: peptidoglycan DD-metalloendopeptidase family protein [Acinetobacter sp.]|nr:peptidoglycan DD-metalloendopeptidase family protein [Acinetobacter sp.]MBP8206981.1 peptidoglycan DD-metalloendopeptidase family protein [Acinetobacter sp.]
MLLARRQNVLTHKLTFKTLFASLAVVSVFAITGCASKPQINNSARYAKAPDFYTVRSGDTLSGIANRYGLSYISVAEMNDIAPPYRIYVKQSLRLKQNGNRNRTTAVKPLATQDSQIKRQNIQLPTTQTAPVPVTAPTTTTRTVPPTVPANSAVNTSTLRWVKPSNGAVLENFNNAANVKGIRFGGNVGDPVMAAANGQVVYAADGLKEYGNLVLVKHIDGYISAYAHNSKMLVKSGQNVTAGQQIAEMGSSGTNRTMLEFQIRLDGKPINPANILPIN